MWIVPIVWWFLCFFLLLRRGIEWRAAFLAAAVAWGCLVTAITECLSFFGWLTAAGLILCWALAVIAILIVHVTLRHPWIAWQRVRLSFAEKILIAGIALVCVTTFVTAILAPPNTWDSMTYHMSRVMHWLQNRSVDHYPTHIIRQIEMNPWAEFAISHFQALSGGDRFANLVQWFSMIGSVIGTSLIARQLGGSRWTQLVSATVTVTIPMGILQASSTQNDYVVAFWLLCLAWAMLRYIDDRALIWATMIGACLGLAILSKGTAYIFALPFLFWLAFYIFRPPARTIALTLLCIVVPFILLNVNHYQRNWEVFANPLSSGESSHFNTSMSAATLFSNLLRNTAMQLNSPSEQLNRLIDEAVVATHRVLGLHPSDPDTSWAGTRFSVGYPNRHEDTTGNFLHVLLFAAALLTLGVRFLRTKKRTPTLLYYCIAVIAAYLLYCFLLRWQPWISRLLLPLCVLGAPALAMICASYWKRGVTNIAVLALLVAALPWTFSNNSRPLMHLSAEQGAQFPLLSLDRNLLYFMNKGESVYIRYSMIARDIQQKGATRIGLIMGEDSWEYPLWVFLKEASVEGFRIEHINVMNVSGSTRDEDFQPDYTLRLR